jgi:hypothetical protein
VLDVITKYSDGKPTLVFCDSKKACESLAYKLASAASALASRPTHEAADRFAGVNNPKLRCVRAGWGRSTYIAPPLHSYAHTHTQPHTTGSCSRRGTARSPSTTPASPPTTAPAWSASSSRARSASSAAPARSPWASTRPRTSSSSRVRAGGRGRVQRLAACHCTLGLLTLSRLLPLPPRNRRHRHVARGGHGLRGHGRIIRAPDDRARGPAGLRRP